jgi:hypothetical protein
VTCSGVVSHIGFLSDGIPDLGTMTAACPGVIPRISLMYDQSGNGNNAAPQTSAVTGSISGNTLTVTAVASGTILTSQTVLGNGVTAETVSAQTSGTAGGVGVYTLSGVAQTVASESLTIGSYPEIPTYKWPGANGPPIVFDPLAPVVGSAGAQASEYLVIPNTFTLPGSTISVAMLASAYDAALAHPFAQIGIPAPNSLSIFSQIGGSVGIEISGGSVLPTTTPVATQPFALVLADGGSTRTLNIDDATYTQGLGAKNTLTGGRLGAFGNDASGVLPNVISNPRMWAFIVWPVTLTTAQMTGIKASLGATFGTTPQARDNLVCDGDSRYQGYGATQSRNICLRMSPLLGRPVKLAIAAIQGRTIEQQAANYAANVAPMYNAASKNNLLDFEAGINDFIVPPAFTGSISGNTLTTTAVPTGYLAINQTIAGAGVTAAAILSQASGTPGGIGTYTLSGAAQTVASEAMTASQSAAGAYTALTGYVAVAHTTGWRVGCHTILPATPLSTGTLQTAWSTYNGLVKANAAACDYIVDEQGDPTIGPLSADTNTTYYIDGIHLTDYGEEIEATIIGTALTAQFR